jgi:hypothetical protein
VVEDSRSERQATLLATGSSPLSPQWIEWPLNREKRVLAYLRRRDAATLPRPILLRRREWLMLWLTWRQHRTQVLVTYGLLLALGAVLFLNGIAAKNGADPSGHFRTLYVDLSSLPALPAF